MMSSKARGFTLIELAVYSGLLGFLLTGLYLITRGGLHYYRTSVAYQTVQQQALVALSKLTSELANSDPRSVSLEGGQGGPNIKFLSADAYLDPGQPWAFDAGTSRLLWRKWVAYQRLPSLDLTRSELRVAPPTGVVVPPFPAAPLLTAFPGIGTPAWRVVAKGVEVFEIRTMLDRVDIELVTRQETASNKKSFVRLHTAVRLENQS